MGMKRGLRAIRSQPFARVAAQGDVDISSAPATGSPVWDGKTISAGNPVMLGRQTDQTEGGLYIYPGVGLPMLRHRKMDSGGDLFDGLTVKVGEGDDDKDTSWRLTTDLPPGGYVIGTTLLTWLRQSGGASGGVGSWEHFESFSLVEGQTDYLFTGVSEASTDAASALVQWGGIVLIPTTDYARLADRVRLASAPDAEQAAGGTPLAVRVGIEV